MSLIIQSLCHRILDGARERVLFSELNLLLAQGDCIALMGDSGSGKTTLLNLISGLEPIQMGEIRVAQTPLFGASDSQLSELRKRHIGIIFQHYNLLSSLSVRGNIEFSARLSGRPNSQLSQALAKKLHIDHLLDKYPATLSGGEMQRVAIARALSARPQLLLADEPTGNLDRRNSEQVVTQLVELAKSNLAALLLVTHSHEVASKMDKVYRLQGGALSVLESRA